MLGRALWRGALVLACLSLALGAGAYAQETESIDAETCCDPCLGAGGYGAGYGGDYGAGAGTAGTGAYGRITGIEGANAILDRPAGFKGMSDKPVWLVVEKKPGGQIVTDLSAVMSVLVTRTALREKSST